MQGCLPTGIYHVHRISDQEPYDARVSRTVLRAAGSDTGGKRAAVLYSLLGTRQLNGVVPVAWLRYIIGHIQDWPVNRLPWKVDLPLA